MRSATPAFFTTFASTKSLMRQRSSQRLKNVAASLYAPCSCDTVKAVVPGPCAALGLSSDLAVLHRDVLLVNDVELLGHEQPRLARPTWPTWVLYPWPVP